MTKSLLAAMMFSMIATTASAQFVQLSGVEVSMGSQVVESDISDAWTTFAHDHAEMVKVTAGVPFTVHSDFFMIGFTPNVGVLIQDGSHLFNTRNSLDSYQLMLTTQVGALLPIKDHIAAAVTVPLSGGVLVPVADMPGVKSTPGLIGTVGMRFMLYFDVHGATLGFGGEYTVGESWRALTYGDVTFADQTANYSGGSLLLTLTPNTL